MEQITESSKAVAEGVLTSKAAHALAEKLGIDCPIIRQIYLIVHGAAGIGSRGWGDGLRVEYQYAQRSG